MKKVAIVFCVLFALAAAVVCLLCLFNVLPDMLWLECVLIVTFGVDVFGLLRANSAKESNNIPVVAVILCLTIGGILPGLFLHLYKKRLVKKIN